MDSDGPVDNRQKVGASGLGRWRLADGAGHGVIVRSNFVFRGT